MSSAIGIAALLVGLLLLLPTLVLAVESLAALFPEADRPDPPTDERVPGPKTALLIPAHQEQAVIGDTLHTVRLQVPRDWRILVVAHNCSDDTAVIARRFDGVEVLDCEDSGRSGKPAALCAGLAALDGDPPEVVVILDADCSVGPEALPRLARCAAGTRQPCMGAYELYAPPDGGWFALVSSEACWIKNVLRPRGLHRLGLPCLINGSGVAAPFRLLRDIGHGEGSIAEDYQLTIDLLREGHPTRFVPAAGIRSPLPVGREAGLRQRRRWEHGYLQILLFQAPRLLLEGLFGFDRRRVALGLELLVPPLSLMAIAWGVGLSASLVAVVAGQADPWADRALWLHLGLGAVLALSLGIAVLRFRGARRVARLILAMPRYALAKVPTYLQFWTRRERSWLGTGR
jgi:cellulose synthase/poly-beta-1,6-N-acetylglucosamine synthase-like glycosyltransferase